MVLTPKEFGGQGFGQFGLTNSGWTKEEERTNWAFGSFKPALDDGWLGKQQRIASS